MGLEPSIRNQSRWRNVCTSHADSCRMKGSGGVEVQLQLQLPSSIDWVRGSRPRYWHFTLVFLELHKPPLHGL